MKHRQQMIAVALVVLVFSGLVFFASRADALILKPISIPPCTFCIDNRITVADTPDEPVAVLKKAQPVTTNDAEVERLKKQIAELQKVLAVLLANRN